MSRFSRAAVVAKPDGSADSRLEDLLRVIARAGVSVVVSRDCAAHLVGRWESVPDEDLFSGCDVCVVLGGDGTMLGAARRLVRTELPIIGVNAGRLGFITDVELRDMPRILPRMLAGEYEVDRRAILEGELLRGEETVAQGIAVNEACIAHGRVMGMIQYTVRVGGRLVAVQRADAFVVSTSTGSTAYSLAAGGPILHPALDAMLLAPVAPHTLSNRPIVLPQDSCVEVELNEARSAVMGFDAQQIHEMRPGDVLRVRCVPKAWTILHPAGLSCFENLRRKLQWNYLPMSEDPVHRVQRPGDDLGGGDPRS